jgi:hypothetical protein
MLKNTLPGPWLAYLRQHGQAAIQNTAARLGGRSTAADHLAVLNAAIAAIAARCRRHPGGG